MAEATATLLVEMQDVLPLGVIQLLIAQGIAVEVIKQGLDAHLHIDAGLRIGRARIRLINQHGNAGLQRLQPLTSPGLEQVAAALETLLTLQQRGGATQLLQGIRQSNPLQFTRLQQRRQP